MVFCTNLVSRAFLLPASERATVVDSGVGHLLLSSLFRSKSIQKTLVQADNIV